LYTVTWQSREQASLGLAYMTVRPGKVPVSHNFTAEKKTYENFVTNDPKRNVVEKKMEQIRPGLPCPIQDWAL